MSVYSVDYPARIIINSDNFDTAESPTPSRLKKWLMNPDLYEIRGVHIKPDGGRVFYIDITVDI